MVANTFTTEFSTAGARSVSAARAAARGTTAAWKLQSKQKLINPIRLEDVMCAVRVLFPIDREGEQGVARIDVHHPVHDGRSTVVQGTAARLDTVLGWKVLCRVEVPQDLAVDGGISAQMPVHRSRKRASRHDGDRLRLCVRAIALAPAAGRLRSGGVPAGNTGRHIQRRQTSGGIRRLRQQTRDGDVEAAVIRGAAPGNAARSARDPGRPDHTGDSRYAAARGTWAAVADFRLPQDLAAVIGIQAVDDAGLLSRQ